jgi:hypothetical protein
MKRILPLSPFVTFASFATFCSNFFAYFCPDSRAMSSPLPPNACGPRPSQKEAKNSTEGSKGSKGERRPYRAGALHSPQRAKRDASLTLALAALNVPGRPARDPGLTEIGTGQIFRSTKDWSFYVSLAAAACRRYRGRYRGCYRREGQSAHAAKPQLGTGRHGSRPRFPADPDES